MGLGCRGRAPRPEPLCYQVMHPSASLPPVLECTGELASAGERAWLYSSHDRDRGLGPTGATAAKGVLIGTVARAASALATGFPKENAVRLESSWLVPPNRFRVYSC